MVHSRGVRRSRYILQQGEEEVVNYRGEQRVGKIGGGIL